MIRYTMGPYSVILDVTDLNSRAPVEVTGPDDLPRRTLSSIITGSAGLHGHIVGKVTTAADLAIAVSQASERGFELTLTEGAAILRQSYESGVPVGAKS